MTHPRDHMSIASQNGSPTEIEIVSFNPHFLSFANQLINSIVVVIIYLK